MTVCAYSGSDVLLSLAFVAGCCLVAGFSLGLLFPRVRT